MKPTSAPIDSLQRAAPDAALGTADAPSAGRVPEHSLQSSSAEEE